VFAAGTVKVPPLAAIEFVSARQGWAVGAGRILATSDEGQAWLTQYHGPARLDGVDFVDARHGWAAGMGDLLATTDGGPTWTALPEPCPVIRSVHFVNPSFGSAVAGGSDVRIDGAEPAPVAGGQLVVPTHGGRSWQPVPGAPAGAQTACFSSAADGFLGMPGRIWRSTDGGRRWSLSFAEPAQPGYAWHQPGGTAVVECAGRSAAWVLFLGFGAAPSHAPYIAFATQDARRWHALFEETYTESAIMPEVHAPAGPGSYPGPFSAISPDAAAFRWLGPVVRLRCRPAGDGGKPRRPQHAGQRERHDAGLRRRVHQHHPGLGGRHRPDSSGHHGKPVIEATTNGGLSWTRQYQTG
jgi:hypothetical protein